MIVRALALAAAVAAVGCTQSPVEYGRSLFSDPKVSDASLNPFSCATCHETGAQPTKQLPGYVLHDAAVRMAWWGGDVTTLFDATNQCVTNFMRGRALTPDDEKGRAIYAYLASISPDMTAPTQPLTVTQNIVDIPSGDATRGKTTWDQSCANCHGAPHTGAGRLSDAVSLVPDDSIAAHGTDPRTGARPVVIEKVRHGKFFNVGGNMPLFSLEAMSDAQLGDILAYLETFGLPPYSPTM